MEYELVKCDLKNIPCFGVAGNFTEHLEQAGEADFFKDDFFDKNSPKAIFPTYFPKSSSVIPRFLNIFPFSSKIISFPPEEKKIQIESECAVVFDLIWKNGFISDMKSVCFSASNDCSIRKAGGVKISQKKNWGENSKGFSEKVIALPSFDENSLLSDYRIKSYLFRNGKAYEYGEDSPVREYSCVFKNLTYWLIEKFNTQKDEGVTENLLSYMNSIGKPERIMVSLGSTRYTEYGNENYLQKSDEALVILYPESRYTKEKIASLIKNRDFSCDDIIFLNQKIV